MLLGVPGELLRLREGADSRALLGSFFLAVLWEIFERSAEKKWPQVWLHPEGWLNAWVSDPLTAFLGVWFAYYLVAKQ